MKKTITLAIAILVAAAAIFTACGRTEVTETTTETTTETETTFTTASTTESTTEFTTSNGLRFEDLPIGQETTEEVTTKSHYDTLVEIYNKLGIEYITSFSEFEISDKTLIISRTSGKIESIFPTNEFLNSHDLQFFGNNIERYVPEALEDGEYAEGPIVAIFEKDLKTRTAIRWTGELKIIVDGEYTIIIDPEN